MSERLSPDCLAAFYENARRYVIRAGYGEELLWQESVTLDGLTESAYLRETGWVILGSGMREAVVRRAFPAVSSAFLEWRSAADIERRHKCCEQRALRYFHNPRKIRAIVTVCSDVARMGFVAIHQSLKRDGLAYIRKMPYMGPVTSFHLGKNIGLQCVKPDRHLVRMTVAAGYDSVEGMCSEIAHAVGDKISVVDLVLWRYAACGEKYSAAFEEWRRA